MKEEAFIYRIDNSDTIVSVSDNWDSFAYGNAWDSGCRPEDVVGHKLWDFIKDIETQHLYAEMFQRVRSGMRCGPIPFHCDSPQERRFLELVLVLMTDKQIEVTSRILRTESREPVGLLDRETARTSRLIKLCSMCKKMETPNKEWAEIEAGLAELRLFEATEMPQITHGLCPHCYNATMAELDD
jgi:hypothetical protein